MHGIDRREGDDERVERKTAMQAPFQQGDGVPDWASKAFAEQTLEKGPVEGSEPRGPEPADKTYESAASKDPFVHTMGPGAGSMAATRTQKAYTSRLTGPKPDAIRKLEGTGPEWQPSKRQKLKAYDPKSVDTARERVDKARQGVRDNMKEHAQRYKKPEEPLTKRESEPEPKRSMFQKIKDHFKSTPAELPNVPQEDQATADLQFMAPRTWNPRHHTESDLYPHPSVWTPFTRKSKSVMKERFPGPRKEND